MRLRLVPGPGKLPVPGKLRYTEAERSSVPGTDEIIQTIVAARRNSTRCLVDVKAHC
jgi:hypothetical protein